jgi:nicotinate-nucleotide adenylyltransferase
MAREGRPLLSAEELRGALRLPSEAAVRLEVVQVPYIGIASRDLRRRAAQGHSLRYLVPRAVEAYILDKGLYQSPQASVKEYPS